MGPKQQMRENNIVGKLGSISERMESTRLYGTMLHARERTYTVPGVKRLENLVEQGS